MKNQFWKMASFLASTASILTSAASNGLYVDLHCIFNNTGGQKNQIQHFEWGIFFKYFFSVGGNLINGLLEAALEAKSLTISIGGQSQSKIRKSRVGITFLSLKWRELSYFKDVVG